MTFIIRHFDDYHEIRSNKYKTIELGCFPTKNYSYFRYFGLFYNGVKPSLKDVLKRLKKKVFVADSYHCNYYGDKIRMTYKYVEQEVKSRFVGNIRMPE